MSAAHKHLVEKQGLNDSHFDAVVELLAATLKQLGVSDADIGEVAKVAESVRDDILCRPKGSKPAEKSLYDRLGGSAAVDAAVDIFYEKVLADKRIKHFFAKTDMVKQRAHQKAFLTVAFGGPNKYSGRSMSAAHKHLVEQQGLNDSHFDTIVELLAATLKQLGVPEKDIKEVGAVAESVRDDVLCRDAGSVTEVEVSGSVVAPRNTVCGAWLCDGEHVEQQQRPAESSGSWWTRGWPFGG
eukprot:GDKI01018151.1.p2 GENE.GDKI01018151.1~~GDKI01018151.1.p2  ORF type:complete len:241 (+),score=83.87 GDKI01018151.1:2-724(+)